MNWSAAIVDGSTANDADAVPAPDVVARTPLEPRNVASVPIAAHVDSVPVSASMIPNGATLDASGEPGRWHQPTKAQIGALLPPLHRRLRSSSAGASPPMLVRSVLCSGNVVELIVCVDGAARANGPTGISMSTIIDRAPAYCICL